MPGHALVSDRNRTAAGCGWRPALGFQLISQLLIVAPYLLALVLLLFAAKDRGPRALGKAFQRGTA